MGEKELLESVLGSAKEYIKTSIELIKLNVIDKFTDAVSTAIPLTVVIILCSIFLLFLSIGAAFWLGYLTGRIYYGFFIVAGFYFLLAIVIQFFLHKSLKRLIGDYFVKQMLK